MTKREVRTRTAKRAASRAEERSRSRDERNAAAFSRRTREPLSNEIIPPTAAAPSFLRLIDKLVCDSSANGRLPLPELRPFEGGCILSDYGGAHNAARWRTYSFLAVAGGAHLRFLERVRELRQKHRLVEPYSEIAFKNRKYGPVARVIPDFVQAALEELPGLLLTLAVPKSLSSIIGGDNDARGLLAHLNSLGFHAHSTPAVAEEAVRVVLLVAYLSCLLFRTDQPVFWMTDRDAIAQTLEHKDALNRLLNQTVQAYGSRTAQLGWTTQPSDSFRAKHGVDFNDLLALPDLVAGAVALGLSLGEVEFASHAMLKSVFQLLGSQSTMLRRATLLLERDDTPRMTVSLVEFATGNNPRRLFASCE